MVALSVDPIQLRHCVDGLAIGKHSLRGRRKHSTTRGRIDSNLIGEHSRVTRQFQRLHIEGLGRQRGTPDREQMPSCILRIRVEGSQRLRFSACSTNQPSIPSGLASAQDRRSARRLAGTRAQPCCDSPFPSTVARTGVPPVAETRCSTSAPANRMTPFRLQVALAESIISAGQSSTGKPPARGTF